MPCSACWNERDAFLWNVVFTDLSLFDPSLCRFWVNYLECRLLEKRPQFLQQAREVGEAVYQEKLARLAEAARSREQDTQASTAAASSSTGGEAVGDEDKMEQLVEQAEAIVEDITHQTGKKKKKIMAVAEVPTKCEAELRREKNMAEHRKMALDLGLIKEKKSKQPAAKRKAPASETLVPTRRSGREKKPVKYFNEDVDWSTTARGERLRRTRLRRRWCSSLCGGPLVPSPSWTTPWLTPTWTAASSAMAARCTCRRPASSTVTRA